MCLAVPFKVVEIAPGRTSGKVLVSGTPCDVGFALLDEVEVGDYVLVHAGMAIQRLSPEEGEDSLRTLAEFTEAVAQQDEEPQQDGEDGRAR